VRNGTDTVRGCSGKGKFDHDYCSFPLVQDFGAYAWKTQSPLNICQGDCESDEHCAVGLVCHQRDGYDPVPGCLGKGKFHKDYCVLPSLKDFGVDAWKTKAPMNVCEGGCITDDQCIEGLFCFQRDGFDSVRGCSGKGKGFHDYCAYPALKDFGIDFWKIKSPLDICEGNCESDDHCAEGLICFQRDGYDPVHGCLGKGEYDLDYCVLPPLKDLGVDPKEFYPMNVCEGDCDKDDQCEEGLVCTVRNGTDTVRGCSGKGKFDHDYCSFPLVQDFGANPTELYPMNACEGDCDIDEHCGEGLICFQRDGYDHVPGCLGKGEFDLDYCALPPLNDFGPDAYMVRSPLNVCEGDCGSDDHCAKGLICLQRNGTETVRGCSGKGKFEHDYCATPSLKDFGSDPTDSYPLNLCEGDCDIDEHCGEGLVCFQRDLYNPVTGCLGKGSYDHDYCVVDPDFKEESVSADSEEEFDEWDD